MHNKVIVYIVAIKEISYNNVTCISFIRVLKSQCWLNAVPPMLSFSPINSLGGEGFLAGAGLSPPGPDHCVGLPPLSLCSALPEPDILTLK